MDCSIGALLNVKAPSILSHMNLSVRRSFWNVKETSEEEDCTASGFWEMGEAINILIGDKVLVLFCSRVIMRTALALVVSASMTPCCCCCCCCCHNLCPGSARRHCLRWETSQEQEQRQQGRGASSVRSAAIHSPGENLQTGGEHTCTYHRTEIYFPTFQCHNEYENRCATSYANKCSTVTEVRK